MQIYSLSECVYMCGLHGHKYACVFASSFIIIFGMNLKNKNQNSSTWHFWLQRVTLQSHRNIINIFLIAYSIYLKNIFAFSVRQKKKKSKIILKSHMQNFNVIFILNFVHFQYNYIFQIVLLIRATVYTTLTKKKCDKQWNKVVIFFL